MPERGPAKHPFRMSDIKIVDAELVFFSIAAVERNTADIDPLGLRFPRRLAAFAEDQHIRDDVSPGVGAKGVARQARGGKKFRMSRQIPAELRRFLVERVSGSDEGDGLTRRSDLTKK